MCGIVACLWKEGLTLSKEERVVYQRKLEAGLALLSHRGPDDIGIEEIGTGLLGHSRLSIVDLGHGHQPLKSKISDTSLIWVHNGEIYNHAALREDYALPDTGAYSDSAVIGPLVQKFGAHAFSKLDGVFSTLVFGEDFAFIARDPLGVKPLYYGKDERGVWWFASEWKAIEEVVLKVEIFPPGHCFSLKDGFELYYKPQYKTQAPTIKKEEEAKVKIKEALTQAVSKRLMADVPVAALLSGGLDSSLVAALAQRELQKQGKTLRTYSIGVDPQSDDLKAARMVAEYIGSDHREVIFDIEEGFSSVEEMVRLLETYDVTTIRASTPMYLMSKVIRDEGYKVVLSGEGADEIFGGYLYFGHAPSDEEFHKECLRRVDLLHTADLLRADRSTMGASVEARVPFLDLAFLEVSMAVDPDLKVYKGGRPEKWILREAFKDDALLPEAILWRQKEQFSDGVGYSWVDLLKAKAESTVMDSEFSTRFQKYPVNTPLSKEAVYYRKIFEKAFHFKKGEDLIKPWIPKWQDYDVDPSGRANKSHKATTSTRVVDEKPTSVEVALVGK